MSQPESPLSPAPTTPLGSSLVFLGGEDWLVKTACHECFLRVEHSPSTKDEEGGTDFGWIELSLLSSHDGEWRGAFGRRLRMAWRLLRGHVPWWFDMHTPEEADALISALSLARAHAFGFPPAFQAFGTSNASSQEFTVNG